MSARQVRNSLWYSIKRRTRQLALPMTMTATATPVARPQNAAPPLPVDVLLTAPALPMVTTPTVAPSGRFVAYTVTDNRRRPRGDEMQEYRTGVPSWYALGGDIWISSLATADTRRITETGNNWAPSWSPDGRFVAFFSDRGSQAPVGQAHLWVWDQALGSSRQVSELPVRDSNIDHIEWTADSRSVIVRTYPDGLSPDAYTALVTGRDDLASHVVDTGVTARVFSFDPALKGVAPQTDQFNPDRWLSDLAIVDVTTGAARRLAQVQRNCTYKLSPDRRSLGVAVEKRALRPGAQQFLFDLLEYDVATGRSHRVVSDAAIMWRGGRLPFSWAPSSHALVYRTAGEGDGVDADDELFLVPTDSGTARPIVPKAISSPPEDITSYDPLWAPGGHEVFFVRGRALWRAAADGGEAVQVAAPADRYLRMIEGPSSGQLWSPDRGRSTIVVTLNPNTKQMGFARVELMTGTITQLVEGNQNIVGGHSPPAVTPDGAAVVYEAEDSGHPRNFWIAQGVGLARPRQITDIAPELSRYAAPRAQIIEWRGVDGDTLHGALIYPAGYQSGRRYPLVVRAYGGDDESDNLNRFGFGVAPFESVQVFASRGYAVLLADSRIHLGTPATDLLKTVMPGVDRAIDVRVADPSRIGIMGVSFGGYSTLALIAQTRRFRAAIVRAGFGDLIAGYGQLSPSGINFMLPLAETGDLRMGGTPWDFRDRYIENSPLFYLDRVRTPLLITHGDADPAISSYLSGEVFTALRRLGQRVEYVHYVGEGHHEEAWTLANQIDALTRMVAWFDRYLK